MTTKPIEVPALAPQPDTLSAEEISRIAHELITLTRLMASRSDGQGLLEPQADELAQLLSRVVRARQLLHATLATRPARC